VLFFYYFAQNKKTANISAPESRNSKAKTALATDFQNTKIEVLSYLFGTHIDRASYDC